jgi:hypothetical protein
MRNLGIQRHPPPPQGRKSNVIHFPETLLSNSSTKALCGGGGEREGDVGKLAFAEDADGGERGGRGAGGGFLLPGSC